MFFADPTYIDQSVYDLWLKGLSEADATKKRQASGCMKYVGASHKAIVSDTRDQYRLFNMLEHFLQSPPMLEKQMLLQIAPDIQQLLIEKYYMFDKEVIRELLGKKLTGRLRKDLDDVSEKTGVSLKSCRRQFDNIKNVFRSIEETEGGTLTDNVKKGFLVSDSLARYYACIVFMAIHRLETSKKRLLYLTFDDLAYCSERMIEHWTVGSEADTQGQDAGDTGAEFDRVFLQELRDLRIFVNDKETVDEHKSLVCQHLRKNVSKQFAASVEGNFKSLCRGLLNIGSGLIHSREVKDIFSDLVEKFIEPCKQLDWNSRELEAFFVALDETCGKLQAVHRNNSERLVPVYRRYVTVSQKCIVRMFVSAT